MLGTIFLGGQLEDCQACRGRLPSFPRIRNHTPDHPKGRLCSCFGTSLILWLREGQSARGEQGVYISSQVLLDSVSLASSLFGSPAYFFS